MDSCFNLTTDETKLVTLSGATPVETRRRSMPGRVGPWPIKRSRSEADQYTPSTAPIFEDPWEEAKGTPSMREVLRKIDEDCATIETLVDNERRATLTCDVDRSSSEEDRELRKAPPIDIVQARANTLLVILALAALVIFVWPPMMAFVFAHRKWGKIMLKKEAPSLTVFGVLLAIPIIFISMVLVIAGYTVAELKSKRNVLHQRHRVLWLALGGLSFGFLLLIWILILLLPLLSHE